MGGGSGARIGEGGQVSGKMGVNGKRVQALCGSVRRCSQWEEGAASGGGGGSGMKLQPVGGQWEEGRWEKGTDSERRVYAVGRVSKWKHGGRDRGEWGSESRGCSGRKVRQWSYCDLVVSPFQLTHTHHPATVFTLIHVAG